MTSRCKRGKIDLAPFWMRSDISVPITIDDVRHIAALAHLDIDESDLETYRVQLQSILEYVAIVDTLELEGIPATSCVSELSGEWREDRPGESISPEEALRNAPDRSRDMFRIPQVLKR